MLEFNEKKSKTGCQGAENNQDHRCPRKSMKKKKSNSVILALLVHSNLEWFFFYKKKTNIKTYIKQYYKA